MIKKRLFNLFISSCIFLLLMVVVEFLLGVFFDQRLQETVPQRHIYLKEHSPNASKTYDQDLGFFLKSDSSGRTRTVRFEIDEKGYIEPSNILKDPDLTIAFLGGSTTECSAVDELQRFPYKVGELLNQRGLRVNTMNAAVSGNNTVHTLNIYLNKVLVDEPDIAVMMHNINDLHELIRSETYWLSHDGKPLHIITEETAGFSKTLWLNFKNVFPNIGLRLDNVLHNLEKKPAPSPREMPRLTEEDKNYIYRQFRENLSLFVSISRIKGVVPVLMTQGNRIKGNLLGLEQMVRLLEENYNIPIGEYKQLYAGMNQIIRKVSEEQSVLMIDLDKVVLPEHLYDAVHFTDEGSVFAGGEIAERLIPLVRIMSR